MLYTLKIYAQSNEVHFLWEDMTQLIFKVYHSKAPKHVSTGCFMCEKIMYSCYVSNYLFYSLLFLEWALCVWNNYNKPFLPSQVVKAWFLIHSQITLKHHRSLAKLRLNSDHNTVESWCALSSTLMFLPSLSGQGYFVK